MKLPITVGITGAALMLLMGSATADDKSTPTTADKGSGDQKASKVIGSAVRNPNDDKLGSVEDLVVNLARGRVLGVVISSGGFLGIGNELSVVPSQAFTPDDNNKLLRLDTTKERLTEAPRFESSKWPDFNDREFMNKLYEAYHVVPYPVERAKLDSSLSPDDSSRRATKILNLSVKNTHKENLGEIKDLVLDDRVSKVLAVVISSGGFLGMGDHLSVVPPQVISFKDNSAWIDASKETLGKSPHFDPADWPQGMTEQSYLNRVYEPFRMKRADSSTAPDNTGINTRDREGTNPTPLDQGNDTQDLELTRKIRQNIMADSSLSFDAKNIKVITTGGKVTLRGTVSSKREMEDIASIAEKFTSAEKVTNQLEVKNNND